MPIPAPELTGFTVSATEGMLMGLRVLPCWDALADKLPSPNARLVSISVGLPGYRLDPLEWQVWEYANGTVPLFAIAQQLRLSPEKVQQIAFRLSAIGLTTVRERMYKPQQTFLI